MRLRPPPSPRATMDEHMDSAFFFSRNQFELEARPEVNQRPRNCDERPPPQSDRTLPGQRGGHPSRPHPDPAPQACSPLPGRPSDPSAAPPAVGERAAEGARLRPPRSGERGGRTPSGASPRSPQACASRELREATVLGWRGRAGGPGACTCRGRARTQVLRCGRDVLLSSLGWRVAGSRAVAVGPPLSASALPLQPPPVIGSATLPRGHLARRSPPPLAGLCLTLGAGQGSSSPCPVGSWAAGRHGPGPGSAGPPGLPAGPAPPTVFVEQPSSPC